MREQRITARSIGVLVALSVSAFAYVTAEILPIGLMLTMSADLQKSTSAVGLLVTSYGLVVVVVSLPLTHLTRRVPRRYVLSGLLTVFVVTTVVSAFAANYWTLLAARMVTAVSQALFWSVVAATAAGLFAPRMRGRAVAVVFGGASLATVLGVPAGTWLGQQAGWRMAFLGLSGVGLLALLTVAKLLPSAPPELSHAARGATPDAGRYGMLLVMTVLAVTGTFVAFTYITPFLTDVSAFSAAAIGPLLLVRGAAGFVGVFAGGAFVDRSPRMSMVIPVGLQAAALLGLYVLGESPVMVVGLVALSGLSFAALTTALSTRVLEVAPGSADLASSGASVAVNVGITVGALLGSVLLPVSGVRTTALAGGVLGLAAFVAVLCEPLVSSKRRAKTSPNRQASNPQLDPVG